MGERRGWFGASQKKTVAHRGTRGGAAGWVGKQRDCNLGHGLYGVRACGGATENHSLEHPRTDWIFRFTKASGQGRKEGENRRGAFGLNQRGGTAKLKNYMSPVYPPPPLISTIRTTQALRDFASSHSTSMDSGFMVSERHKNRWPLIAWNGDPYKVSAPVSKVRP